MVFKVKAVYTGTTTRTISENGKAVAIQNRGSTDLTLTVNGNNVVVEPDVFIPPDKLYFGGFDTVLVTASGAWQLFIYE